MKKMKSIIMSVLAVFTLFSSGIAIHADDTRVTFTNGKNDKPDLYISKKVVCEDKYVTIPDESFTFILKIDDKLASQVTYTILDENGVQLKDDSNKVISFKTTRNGEFSLKANQTAYFEYVGTGKKYEVKELSHEGFIQISPANGSSIVGTISSDGSQVTFVNQYVPTFEQEKAKFIVSKRVSYPEGYVLPFDDDFGFTLTIDGKIFTNEKFSIRDDQTMNIVGEDLTDNKGHFTLKAGFSAIFDEIDSNVDYRIIEDEKEGWRVIGDYVQQGAIQSPITSVHYMNAVASFGVSKRLIDSESDEVFTFLLLKDDKKVFSGAKYYLYNLDGTLVDEDIHETDEAGYFELKADQCAIFVGIEPEKVVHVREEAHIGFMQVNPVDSNGYQNKVIQENVEIYPFENKPIDLKGKLSVTKVIKNLGNDAAHDDVEFTFVITKVNEPVAFASYSIGGNTYMTNELGEFKLKPNQTAIFDNLRLNEVYQIEEVQEHLEYQIEGNRIQSGLLEESLSFTFTNLYYSKYLDIQLTKKNRNDEVLSGAVFALYMDEDLNNPIEENLMSDENGKIVISNCKAGIYYLVETKAPNGYNLLVSPIKIEIKREVGQKVIVLVNDQEITDYAKEIHIELNSNANDVISMTVFNDSRFSLPITGGTGILMILAFALMGLIVLFIQMKQRLMRNN